MAALSVLTFQTWEELAVGGYRAVWGKTQKQHDELIRALRDMTSRTIESLAAVHANLLESAEHTESIALTAAREAGLAYGGPPPEAPPFASLDIIAKTLDGPRHLMMPAEIALYRARIRSILKLSDANVRESARLAATIQRARDSLRKLERFYSMKEKPTAARRRKPAAKSRRSR
jgi:hypothetical protein